MVLASSGWTATTTRQAAVATAIDQTHKWLALLAALADLALAAMAARPAREAKALTIRAQAVVVVLKTISQTVTLMSLIRLAKTLKASEAFFTKAGAAVTES